MKRPGKSHQAYFLRAEGKNWSEILVEVGSGSSVANLTRATKRWAQIRGMAWPPEPDQELLPTSSRKELRKRWRQEYETVRDPNIPLSDGARRWAQENDLPWPPEGRNPQERCYTMKTEGHTWEEIQAAGGYKNLHHAIEAARRWAEANQLKWPLPGMFDRNQSRERQARAYQMHVEGTTLEEIREVLGYKSNAGVYNGIRAHAARNGLPGLNDLKRARKEGP